MEDDDLSEAEEELLGNLRVQLAAVGSEFGPLVIDRLKRMLRSESVAANTAAIKILLERLAPVEGGDGGYDPEAFQGDYETISTRALREAAFATPKSWAKDFSPESNLGAKVDMLIAVNERVASGRYIDPDDLAEAKREAAAITRWRKVTEPL